MKIPKDPKERFQYYFDITTGLDEKYQTKIDKISAETFSYDPEKTGAYKNAVKENAAEADYLKKKYRGDYAEYSQGYDNSMQSISTREIDAEEKRMNSEAYKALYNAKYDAWIADKKRRIESAKRKYARAYGNAYNNMLKANEEITLAAARK